MVSIVVAKSGKADMLASVAADLWPNRDQKSFLISQQRQDYLGLIALIDKPPWLPPGFGCSRPDTSVGHIACMSFTFVFLLAIAVIAAIAATRIMARPAKASSAARSSSQRAAAQKVTIQVHAAPISAPTEAPKTSKPLIPAMAGCDKVSTEAIPADRRDTLLHELRGLPRPPLALHQLVSPAFLDTATSGEISDLIMGDAQIAAKVLALVNSPFYGLSRPVMSVGQAVTFLGLNSIRTICLNYMLEESFAAISPDRQQTFSTIMKASNLAGELCNHLAHRLDLPERGSLSTQVVLSFLGHLAAAALMPANTHVWRAEFGLLERSEAEQRYLGLNANQLGSLLMREWGLPEILITQVARIDICLSAPNDKVPAKGILRAAYGYLCARLGERLAQGGLTDLANFDLAAEEGVDLLNFKNQIDASQLVQLSAILRSAEIRNTIERITMSARQPNNR